MSWQKELKTLASDPSTLIESLKLPEHLTSSARQADALFKTRVPQAFLNRIETGNVNDPLLKQVLPTAEELESHPDYVSDPLQETEANPIPGLLHKYHGRVLMIVTGSCAINCRYCFRRQFPYQANNPGKAGWQTALDYIATDTSIHEVILSGGDPLMASDTHLQFLIEAISAIDHVSTLRVHTRIPIALPSRITPTLINLFKASGLKVVIVIHCNHANEIDQPVKQALQTLHDAGFTLLNQSVLLKGINDNADTLIRLSHTLFAAHVLPYYLHALDKVKGATHFEVNIEKAQAIMRHVAKALPGYLVPRFVQEIPHATHKIDIGYESCYSRASDHCRSR